METRTPWPDSRQKLLFIFLFQTKAQTKAIKKGITQNLYNALRQMLAAHAQCPMHTYGFYSNFN